MTFINKNMDGSAKDLVNGLYLQYVYMYIFPPCISFCLTQTQISFIMEMLLI